MNWVSVPIAPCSLSTASRSTTYTYSPIFVDLSLLVHLQTRSIKATMRNTEFTPSRPPTASPKSLVLGLLVDLQTRSFRASKSIWIDACPQPPSTTWSSCHHGLVKKQSTQSIRRAFVRMSSYDPKSTIREWDEMNGYPAVRNYTNCVDLWTLGKCSWDPEVGKMECVCCITRWCLSTPGSAKYIHPVAQSSSIHPPALVAYTVSNIHVSPTPSARFLLPNWMAVVVSYGFSCHNGLQVHL